MLSNSANNMLSLASLLELTEMLQLFYFVLHISAKISVLKKISSVQGLEGGAVHVLEVMEARSRKKTLMQQVSESSS